MGFEKQKPSYAGNGVAMWDAVDKNGKAFYKVKVLNGSVINCFKVEDIKEVAQQSFFFLLILMIVYVIYIIKLVGVDQINQMVSN